jgi:hypothetical protein
VAQKETEQLNQILLYAALSRVVCTVAELGVADHIEAGKPQTAGHLAHATGAHEKPLYRALRFLASHGIFQETKHGEFDHTPLSNVLRSDAEGSYRAAGQMFHHIFAGFDGLDHAIRTGEPGFNKVHGRPLFEFFGAHPEIAPVLDAAMTSIHGYETAAMVAAYDFGGVRVLADIGGGNGSLIRTVLQRYPKLRGILFDLGHVVGRTKESLKGYGVADRCQTIEGSFFETIPAGADAYLFRHILHDWTDEQCVQILSHCRKVIPSDGRLLIVECVVPTGNGRSISKDFDMVMMTFPGGAERSESEFRVLFKQAGFDLTSVTPTASPVSVVEGRPGPTV